LTIQAIYYVKRWFGGVWANLLPGLGKRAPLRWTLDSPVGGVPLGDNERGWLVQGWVLPDEVVPSAELTAQIVADWDPHMELVNPVDVPRPDVVRKILAEDPDESDRLRCGFRFRVPHAIRRFRLWLEQGTQRRLLTTVEIAPEVQAPQQPMQVLRGRGSWLFLDNDTNFSVDQYTGRLRLSHAGLSAWSNYLAALARLGSEKQIPCRLLVAPAKERLLAEFHPLPAGSRNLLDQIMALPEAEVLLDPTADLQPLGEAAFYPNDTHWTHRGAMTASLALVKALGLPGEQLAGVFEGDRYKSRMVAGDLGSKLSPPEKASVEFLVSYGYAKLRVYDNGLPNFGRLVVIENAAAIHKGTCLLFGSSSSYSLFYYLTRAFTRLVFVHSAGNIDQEFFLAVRPDFLVAQTNARFMVRVPGLNFNLAKTMRKKAQQMSAEGWRKTHKLCVPADKETLERLGIAKWASKWAVQQGGEA